MMFALGVAVGCAVAVMLIFTLANLVKQKPTSFMLQAHKETLDLLTEANRLRMCQAAALEKIEARLASHNIGITAKAQTVRGCGTCAHTNRHNCNWHEVECSASDGFAHWSCK